MVQTSDINPTVKHESPGDPLRRYFLGVAAHPLPVLVLGAVLVLAIGGGAFTLKRNTSPDAFIPPEHPALAGKRRVDARFGLAEPIVVGVLRDAPGGIFNPKTLALIRDLTAQIKQLPRVGPADVLSLATESGVYFDANGEPGFDRPQYGHAGSSELISFRQFGQRIDFLSLVGIS